MSKINKALDYNKYTGKETLKFPLLATIKYDGNYTVTIVKGSDITHITSGGLNYKHTDGEPFTGAIDGVYLAERIGKAGKLGDRRYCTLTGPKKDQKSTKHTYKVFDYLTLDEYEAGRSTLEYYQRFSLLCVSGLPLSMLVIPKGIKSKLDLDLLLDSTVKDGYEGLMLIQPDWFWKDTSSRKLEFCKYKKRPTADLLCIGTEDGEGKYQGFIGNLVLVDSVGRQVCVGSGLDDVKRSFSPDYFIGKVIEIEYEQIMDTYIQPTFVCVRIDKSEEDID